MAEQIDVRHLPYMPLVIDRLRKSRAWLRCRRQPELGFYLMNLWMAAYHQVPAGSLEDDNDVLADAAMCDPAKWDAIKNDVMAGWTRRDNRVWHSVVTEIATEAATKTAQNRKRTEAARQARAQAKAAESDAKTISEASVTDHVTEHVTGDVTVSVTETEGRSKKVEGRKEEREESTSGDVDPADAGSGKRYAFDAKTIRLTEKDLGKWKRAFPHLSLEAELWALDEWATQQGKNWFNAVSGALAKKERTATDRANAAKDARENPIDTPRRKEGRI